MSYAMPPADAPAGTPILVTLCACQARYRLAARPLGLSVWQCRICRDTIPAVLGHRIPPGRKQLSDG